MNAPLNSSTGLPQDIASASDSDSNSDAPEFYHPISAVDDLDSEEDSEIEGLDLGFHHLINGLCLNQAENGVSPRDVGEGADLTRNEDEEEERMREASEWAMRRAFRDDENRRHARLSPENATRVVEAMRGISFGGVTPDWVERVPERSWMDQVRRLRQSPGPPN